MKFGELPELDLEVWRLTHPGQRQALREVWDDIAGALTAEFIESHPGTRPWGFWEFEARSTRKILGGAGVIASEHYNYGPNSHFGIPFLVDVRSSDPPVVESEAMYLKRCRRLTANEKL